MQLPAVSRALRTLAEALTVLLRCRDKPSRRGDLLGKAVRGYSQARKKAQKKHGPCKVHLQVCDFPPGWPSHACLRIPRRIHILRSKCRGRICSRLSKSFKRSVTTAGP